MVTDSKHAKVAVAALLIVLVFAAVFLLFFNKPVTAQEVQQCFLNTDTGLCEGVCTEAGDACVYDPVIMDCTCATPCDAASPPNCEQAVCTTAGDHGEQTDPATKCIETESTTGERICACIGAECSEIKHPDYCYKGTCLAGFYCEDNQSCEYEVAQCEWDFAKASCDCVAGPCESKCIKDQCDAECDSADDCANMPGAGTFTCEGQLIQQNLGSCNTDTCMCTLSQIMGALCGGTGENDTCSSPSNAADCDACDVTGDQDGNQDGWTDSIADQCDPNCILPLKAQGKLHIASNSPAVNASTFELSPELTCDGIDNDCNGVVDDINGGKSVDATQCKCFNGTISPGTWRETCNAIDDDCDGKIDENWDIDGDGYVSKSKDCEDVYTVFDCNDNDSAINPDATEVCSGVDNDCDGIIDNVDNGTSINATKCACFAGEIKPGTINETMNGIDDDCDGFIDEGLYNISKEPPVNPLETPTCGDVVCDTTENFATCCADCGCPGDLVCVGNKCVEGEEPEAVCGDNVCEKIRGETVETCPEDCRPWTLIYAGIGIIIAIIVLVLIWWFLFRKPKQELSGLTAAHGIETPTAASAPNIGNYINNCLSLGYGSEQIKSALMTQGWDEETVNAALSETYGSQTALGELAEKHEVDMPHEDVEKVEKYVSDGLKKGFSATEIKTQLLSAGWSEEIIDDALSKQPKLTKELDKLAGKHKIDKPPKNEEKIPDFVEESLNKGHTTKAVKKTLEDAGWTPGVIGDHVPV